MRNAQNEEALIRPDIDDAVVADPQKPQPLELTPKQLASLSASAEFLFDSLKDSGDFFLVDAS